MDVDHRTTSELRGELRTKLATHPKEAKRAQREVWIPLRNGEASAERSLRPTRRKRSELSAKSGIHFGNARRAQHEACDQAQKRGDIGARSGIHFGIARRAMDTWPRGKVGSASADAGQQAGKANPPDDQEHESSIV